MIQNTHSPFMDCCNRLLELRDSYPPLKTAVVHPADAASLGSAVDAAKEQLIIPVLVGNADKIWSVAKAEKLDISKFELVATEHSHAAAEKAVELAHTHQVEALMKGKLHTQEFLQPIVAHDSGLRTSRRMSHVFIVAVPSYHKPLFITDAAINIVPNLDTKRDIIQNAIDLFVLLGWGTPKVAILAAVETVDAKMPSTLDAAALTVMAARGQITGGIVDGPLAFDNAISREAATAKNIISNVAGDADILIVPDLESGNMLYKQMRYLFGVESAGIVLGARVPLILTSRAAERGQTRLASCALALAVARRRQQESSTPVC